MNSTAPLLVLSACLVFASPLAAQDAASPETTAAEARRLFRSEHPADHERAVALASGACAAGSGAACNVLARAHYSGKGAERDFAKSFSFAERSCALGDANGCTLLSLDYRDGVGVRSDLRKAIAFARKACEMGDKAGCTNAANFERVAPPPALPPAPDMKPSASVTLKAGTRVCRQFSVPDMSQRMNYRIQDLQTPEDLTFDVVSVQHRGSRENGMVDVSFCVRAAREAAAREYSITGTVQRRPFLVRASVR